MQKKRACGAIILSSKMTGEKSGWARQISGPEERILLIQRGMTAPIFPGYWALPAGLIEKSETPRECLLRETMEEVGLEFRPTKLFFKGTWEDRELRYYLGAWSGKGIAIQPDEIAGFGWFTIEEALRLPLALRYREVFTLLRRYLNQTK